MKMKLTAALLLITLLFTTGCTTANTSIKKTDLMLDTIVTIEIYGTSDNQILEDCFELGRDYEKKFSRTIKTSEIAQINQAGGQPVSVSDDTITLLKRGIYYGDLTNGAFDITIARVTDLWDFKSEDHTLPDETKLTEAVATVNYRNIKIEGNQVTLLNPNAAIDLGGIAKGYIADQMKAFLKDKGLSHALLDLGGNIQTIGPKPDGSPWTIAVQKPFDDRNSIAATVTVTDHTVVSSGSYERYFELDNKIYHHILNPETGYPFDNSLTGVTIIAKESIDADCLSTSCFALGLEDGMDLIESSDGTEAIFITQDGQLHYSSGLE